MSQCHLGTIFTPTQIKKSHKNIIAVIYSILLHHNMVLFKTRVPLFNIGSGSINTHALQSAICFFYNCKIILNLFIKSNLYININNFFFLISVFVSGRVHMELFRRIL